MTVRTRRRPMVFTKVFPNGQVLKVRFKPQMLVGQSCVWNISSAIGKSHRQLNDWEKKRKNKRAKKLRNLMSGRVGAASLAFIMRTARYCYQLLAPGDSIAFQCEAVCSAKQFEVYKKWLLEREKDPWQVLKDVKGFFIHKPIKRTGKYIYDEVCELELKGKL